MKQFLNDFILSIGIIVGVILLLVAIYITLKIKDSPVDKRNDDIPSMACTTLTIIYAIFMGMGIISEEIISCYLSFAFWSVVIVIRLVIGYDRNENQKEVPE